MAERQRFFTRRRFIAYGLMASAGALSGLDAFVVEPAWMDVTIHEMPTSKLKRALRIVHLSDLHLDHDIRRDGVPERVNALGPDIIALTGDYTNNELDTTFEEDRSRVRGFVCRLKARYGVFATFGNWDGGISEKLFEDTHIVPLRKRSVTVDTEVGTLALSGIDHSWDYAGAARDAAALAGDLDDNVLSILLYHAPDIIDEVAGTGKFDLYLCGHTHGGQVRVPFLDAVGYGFRKPFPYPGSLKTFSRHGSKFDAGMYRVGGTHMYVNRGLGMEGGMPRVRFFCRPEVAVIDVVPSVGQTGG